MNLKRLFGLEGKTSEDEGEGPVVLTLVFGGKHFTRRYPDLGTAQLRFPQFLSDLASLHRDTSG